jgi:hypothetical protein
MFHQWALNGSKSTNGGAIFLRTALSRVGAQSPRSSSPGCPAHQLLVKWMQQRKATPSVLGKMDAA